MSNNLIIARFGEWVSRFRTAPVLDLHHLYKEPGRLPKAVQSSVEAMRCLKLLGPLAWDQFPERDLQRNYGQPSTPYSALAAACLLKLELGIEGFGRLSRWLAENTSIAWLLGFRCARAYFNPALDETILPDQRHFSRLLHKAPNSCFQFLLSSSVQALLAEFTRRKVVVPEVVSIDTKHILAWVKENNPKAYVENRFDKTRQPAGDRDCKLGCKRTHNRRQGCADAPPPAPTSNPLPAAMVKVGEYYWGYASGVAAMKVPHWGEFVVAELTQPFDQPDVSYFLPLMAMVEQRLGKKPPFGALDAAFDAFYVYEYFHQAGGLAAVPFAEKGKTTRRQFDADGLPLCAAGLAMPLKQTFRDRTSTILEHERGLHACPLFFPVSSGKPCPIEDPHWANGGCITTLATSIGARLRHQLDRESQVYKQIFKQRTAVERINSQAKELGIERPRLRNQLAIANINTLIYTLINLRLLRHISQQA